MKKILLFLCFSFCFIAPAAKGKGAFEDHLTKYNKPVYEKCIDTLDETASYSDAELGTHFRKECDCLKTELVKIIKNHIPAEKWQQETIAHLEQSVNALDGYTYNLANLNQNCKTDMDSYSCGTWGRYIIPPTFLRVMLLEMINYTYEILYYYDELK